MFGNVACTLYLVVLDFVPLVYLATMPYHRVLCQCDVVASLYPPVGRASLSVVLSSLPYRLHRDAPYYYFPQKGATSLFLSPHC